MIFLVQRFYGYFGIPVWYSANNSHLLHGNFFSASMLSKVQVYDITRSLHLMMNSNGFKNFNFFSFFLLKTQTDYSLKALFFVRYMILHFWFSFVFSISKFFFLVCPMHTSWQNLDYNLQITNTQFWQYRFGCQKVYFWFCMLCVC